MPLRMLRTVFMGSDPIALPLLDSLVTEHAAQVQLVGVYTQPDRPSGRGMKVQANEIKHWALARGVTLRQTEKLGPGDVDWLLAQQCDLLLVMAYGHILRQRLLDASRLPPLNFHASLLPKLRGASPIETAIATGETRTGVTLMRIVRQLDAGPIMDAEAVDIEADDDRAAVYAKLAQACVPLLRRAIPRLQDGGFRFQPQDDLQATHCRIINKEDGAMDFRAPARELHDRCRAFQPWPGAYFDFAGVRLRVGASKLDGAAPGVAPGTVLPWAAACEGLPVQTGCGVLLLTRLQRPGGRMLPAADFLRGFPVPAGSVLPSQPMPPLVS